MDPRLLVKALGGWRASVFLALALAACGFAGVQTVRLSHAQTALADTRTEAAHAELERAQAAAFASETARLREHELATRANAISVAYERGKDDAKRKGDAVAADLRAGNLRLREQWRGCEADRVPGAAAGAGGPDGSADLRAAGAADLVRAAAEADAWIRALQQVTQSDRGQHASRPGN